MRQVVKPILNRKGTNKVLFVNAARAKSIIGCPQGTNTNVDPVSSGLPYVVGHYYISPSYLTIIGILG